MSNYDAKWEGDKYQPGRDTKDIANDIRGEIRGKVKAGELPKARYSVRISRYSGGSSITVRASDIPFRVIDFMAWKKSEYNAWPLTDRGKRLKADLESIVRSYHRDSSYVQADYFCVNFYYSVYLTETVGV